MSSALPALIQREGAGKGLGHVPFPAIIPRGRASSRNPVNHTVGNVTYAFKADSSLPASTGVGSGELRTDSTPLFFPQVNHLTHSASPGSVLAKQNMEKSVAFVSNTKLPNAEIEKARKIHENLIVRLMISPGDSAGAMWRAEQAFGLSYHCQKNLRYQHRASAEFVARLYAAWASVVQSGISKDVELLRTEAAE